MGLTLPCARQPWGSALEQEWRDEDLLEGDEPQTLRKIRTDGAKAGVLLAVVYGQSSVLILPRRAHLLGAETVKEVLGNQSTSYGSPSLSRSSSSQSARMGRGRVASNVPICPQEERGVEGEI